MSFEIFSGNSKTMQEREVLDMLTQLKTTNADYAISSLRPSIIKEFAQKHGFEVSARTVNYHEVKVILARPDNT